MMIWSPDDCLKIFATWARCKGDLQLAADIDHSSLLRRMLHEGKPPLPEPPPKAYSYPWYGLIDTGRVEKCEVHGPYDSADGMGGDIEGRYVVINQSPWKWVATEDGPIFTVEYHGVRYRVWRDAEAAEAWPNHSWVIERITS